MLAVFSALTGFPEVTHALICVCFPDSRRRRVELQTVRNLSRIQVNTWSTCYFCTCHGWSKCEDSINESLIQCVVLFGALCADANASTSLHEHYFRLFMSLCYDGDFNLSQWMIHVCVCVIVSEYIISCDFCCSNSLLNRISCVFLRTVTLGHLCLKTYRPYSDVDCILSIIITYISLRHH